VNAPLDVGVVGCGFAGCAAGLFLARAGHRVTIYERVAAPSAVGAGILLQPTGLAVLARLGLGDAVEARGAPVTALDCRNAAGRTLFHLRYERVAPGLHGLGAHRGALFEALFDGVRAAGVRLSAGVEVDAVATIGARARVSGPGGAVLGEHDLVVVADGARSHLRARSPALRRARPYRWGALWFVGADADRRFDGVLSQVCAGTGQMVGFLPSGLGPAGGRTPLVSLFSSLRMDRLDEWRRRGLAAWKREVLALEPRADALLEQIRDVEQVLTAGYVDAVMRPLHDGRVVYAGDAAHATSPQLGQGTNLALVDAAVLADALAAEDDVGRALRRFSRARAAHLRFYQVASRWLTPFFQSDRGWLAPLRDRLFPLAMRVPLLHIEMVRTLCGIKRGLFHPSLPLLTPPPAAMALPESASVG
jgi:2-polyprenyl-6-methoxyphenol hydroxylase-like FAD-dependent oxidoreductase